MSKFIEKDNKNNDVFHDKSISIQCVTSHMTPFSILSKVIFVLRDYFFLTLSIHRMRMTRNCENSYTKNIIIC